MNNLQRNFSCNCNCDRAAEITLETTFSVIVVDAFIAWEPEAHAKIVLSIESILCYVIVTWQEVVRTIVLYVCNLFVWKAENHP